MGPSVKDVLSSQKHMRSQRLYDYLSRYEAIITRRHTWTPIDFTDRKVVELGSGPVLGWAPLAVFLGCSSYTCVEPFYNPAILDIPSFIQRYLMQIYKDLSALYGPSMTFEEYLKRLKERIQIVQKRFLEVDLDGSFDIALSNSCLEHVFPLDATIARLKNLSAPKCRFIHVVDFGNHQQSNHPFNNIYTVEPEAYLAKYGKKINLLRASDILSIFRDAGFEVSLTPYYHCREFFSETPIPYWTKRYSENILFLKTGIFFSSANVCD
jgi:hypothetical protein